MRTCYTNLFPCDTAFSQIAHIAITIAPPIDLLKSTIKYDIIKSLKKQVFYMKKCKFEIL